MDRINPPRCPTCGDLLPPVEESDRRTGIAKDATLFGYPVIVVCKRCFQEAIGPHPRPPPLHNYLDS